MFGIDPVAWILGALVNALIAALSVLMHLIELAVLHRPAIDEFPFYDELGGYAVGSSRPLAGLVMFFVLSFAVFWQKARARVWPAIFYAVVVTVATPYWYRTVGAIQDFSIGLTGLVLGIFGDSLTPTPENAQDGVNQLLQFDLKPFAGFDALLGSGTLLLAMSSGGLLVGLVWCYAVLTQIVAFLGLFALALLGFGGRMEKIFQAIVAIALVAVVFGIPVIVLVLEAGIAFVDSPFWANLGADSAFATGFVVNITFGLALLSQAVLLMVFFGVTQKVMGKLRSIAAGGELNARLSGRDLEPDMTQNQAVSRAMTEPERALAQENPSLVHQGTETALNAQSSTTTETSLTQGGNRAIAGGNPGSPTPTPTSGGPSPAGSPAAGGSAPLNPSVPPPPVGVGATTGGSTATAGQAAATGARVVPAAASTAGAGIAGAEVAGASAAGAGAGTAATTAGTAGAAAAAGAPTAGVGAAVVIGGVAAKQTIDHVKEVKATEETTKTEPNNPTT